MSDYEQDSQKEMGREVGIKNRLRRVARMFSSSTKESGTFSLDDSKKASKPIPKQESAFMPVDLIVRHPATYVEPTIEEREELNKVFSHAVNSFSKPGPSPTFIEFVYSSIALETTRQLYPSDYTNDMVTDIIYNPEKFNVDPCHVLHIYRRAYGMPNTTFYTGYVSQRYPYLNNIRI